MIVDSFCVCVDLATATLTYEIYVDFLTLT